MNPIKLENGRIYMEQLAQWAPLVTEVLTNIDASIAKINDLPGSFAAVNWYDAVGGHATKPKRPYLVIHPDGELEYIMDDLDSRYYSDGEVIRIKVRDGVYPWCIANMLSENKNLVRHLCFVLNAYGCVPRHQDSPDDHIALENLKTLLNLFTSMDTVVVADSFAIVEYFAKVLLKESSFEEAFELAVHYSNGGGCFIASGFFNNSSKRQGKAAMYYSSVYQQRQYVAAQEHFGQLTALQDSDGLRMTGFCYNLENTRNALRILWEQNKPWDILPSLVGDT